MIYPHALPNTFRCSPRSKVPNVQSAIGAFPLSLAVDVEDERAMTVFVLDKKEHLPLLQPLYIIVVNIICGNARPQEEMPSYMILMLVIWWLEVRVLRSLP